MPKKELFNLSKKVIAIISRKKLRNHIYEEILDLEKNDISVRIKKIQTTTEFGKCGKLNFKYWRMTK